MTPGARRERSPSPPLDRAVAAEREALLRLGTLASTGTTAELFAAMAEELARIVDPRTGRAHEDMAAVSRFDHEARELVVVAAWGRPHAPVPIGSRWPLEGPEAGDSANVRVWRTGRPARVDGDLPVQGEIARRLQTLAFHTSVAVPIVVDGELWGTATLISSRPAPLPAETGPRLADFAELAATAISGAQRREVVAALTEEQAVLRRVATLVADGADVAEVGREVAAVAGERCGAHRVGVIRFDGDVVRAVAWWGRGGPLPAESWPVAEDALAERLLAWHPEAHTDAHPGVHVADWTAVPGAHAERLRAAGVGSSVAEPVLVATSVWGALAVHAPAGEQLDEGTGARMSGLAQLLATAVANHVARHEARRLGDEQAAMRRIATVVARQPDRAEIVATTVDELHRLGLDDVRIVRFEADGHAVVEDGRGVLAADLPRGHRAVPEGCTVTETVRRTGRPAHDEGYDHRSGVHARLSAEAGLRTGYGCPVLVGDRVWGAVVVGSRCPDGVPDRVVRPVRDAAELLGTAVRNGEARADLAASRARLVAATDAARRRFERDLREGAQRRLTSLLDGITGTHELGPDDLARLADEVEGVLDQLRDLSRGIHPAILSEGGLAPALKSLARRAVIPVSLHVPRAVRFPERIEVAAYHLVAEAVANAGEHAGAPEVVVEVSVPEPDGALTVRISDDGSGGADPTAGSGLIGVVDRVEALGGTLTITSPPGRGTTITAVLPGGPMVTDPRGGTTG